MRVRVTETGIMYVTNLFYHMNKLIQEDGKNRRDGDHSIVADIIICCENNVRFEYSRFLFTVFLRSYFGFPDISISEHIDVVYVPFLSSLELLYMINYFYAVSHDDSCLLCRVAMKNLGAEGTGGKSDFTKNNENEAIISKESVFYQCDINVEESGCESKKTVKKPKDANFTPNQEVPQDKVAVACVYCEYCGNSYDTSLQLKRHYYKKHSISKPNHKCSVCSKMFLRPWDLKRHLVSHSDERKFQCDVCGSKFKRVHLLRQHELIHKEKQYTCFICNEHFGRKSNYERHMSTNHIENKKYICPKCCKSFKRSDVLAVHSKICSGNTV